MVAVTRLTRLQTPLSAQLRTPDIMACVLVALLPGAAVLCWLYGPAYLPRMAFAVALGLSVEAAALRLQRRPIRSALLDGSSTLTCLLLVLAMPPHTPYGVLALAVLAAVGLAKHLYGGLGNNPFNPAIVGYVVALVSFPAAMASWPAAGARAADALTGATVLTSFRYREGLTVADIWQANPAFGTLGGYGWEWVNAAFLAGGRHAHRPAPGQLAGAGRPAGHLGRAERPGLRQRQLPRAWDPRFSTGSREGPCWRPSSLRRTR